MEQALLAAPHDDILLAEVGGHADAIQLGSGRARTAAFPRAARAGNRSVHDMRHIGDRQQRDLRAVERTASCRRTRFGSRAARLRLGVVFTRRFVQQFGDILGLHGIHPRLMTPSLSQVPCQRQRVDFTGIYCTLFCSKRDNASGHNKFRISPTLRFLSKLTAERSFCIFCEAHFVPCAPS